VDELVNVCDMNSLFPVQIWPVLFRWRMSLKLSSPDRVRQGYPGSGCLCLGSSVDVPLHCFHPEATQVSSISPVSPVKTGQTRCYIPGSLKSQ
jgi:hypothetical protein